MPDTLSLWFLGDPGSPRLVGELQLQTAGKGVSLRYAPEWLATGFALSEDRFGALGVSTSPNRYAPRAAGPLPRLGDAQTLSQVVRKINAKEPITALETRMIAAGGSFGGASYRPGGSGCRSRQWLEGPLCKLRRERGRRCKLG